MQLSDQDQRDHNRAELARQVIENELVIDTLAAMERDIYEVWAGVELTPDQREEAHRQLMSLRRFVAAFDGYIMGGAHARLALGIEPEKTSFWQRINDKINGK